MGMTMLERLERLERPEIWLAQVWSGDKLYAQLHWNTMAPPWPQLTARYWMILGAGTACEVYVWDEELELVGTARTGASLN